MAVRDPARAAAAGVPADLLSDAPAHLVADEEIDVIVELMGGDEPAHTLIAAALSMGKSVVTANKHVIAHHGPELETIARRTGAALRFEAAVGGGIPVLGPLATDLAANRVTRVRGIVNGTTNFILSAMTDEDDPLEFAAALAEAQRLGYAEADPSGDVEGHDAVNKLVILARLAFDQWLDPATIPTRPDGADGPAGPGIATVSLGDQVHARAAGRDHPARGRRPSPTRRRRAARRRAPDGAPARLGARADGGRAQPHRGRRDRRSGAWASTVRAPGGPATSSAVLGDLIAVGRGGSGRPGARDARRARRRGDAVSRRRDRPHDDRAAASGTRSMTDQGTRLGPPGRG